VQPGFDDAGWSRGKADFSDGYGKPATPWKEANIWLRTEFPWQNQPLVELKLKLKHDEAATVFLNGTQVLKRTGYTTKYQTFTLPPEALNSIREGRNVLAVHCRNSQGGQFIDAGLTAILAVAPPATATDAPPAADKSSTDRLLAERLIDRGHRVYLRVGEREFRAETSAQTAEAGASVTRIAWKESVEVTAADLESLKGLKSLQGLRLAGCRLTDADARALADLTTLRELDLSGTFVGSGAINVLQSLKGLEWLDLSDTRFTPAQIKIVREHAPGCQVLPLQWLSSPASKRAAPRDLRAGDWKPLFNGRDLEGWTKRGGTWGGVWKSTQGMLRCESGNPRGWLGHDVDFADFQFETEFRFEKPSARTAVCLRMPGKPRGHDGIPTSGDLRINLTSDGARPRRAASDDPTHQNGTLNGIAPPRFEVILPAEVWHRVEVRAIGTRFTVWINDRPTVAVDLATRQGDFPNDAALWAPAGHIGLANSNTPVDFRRIQARPLGKPVRR
jgi:hypothetical protein